jgi:hypothetical protein
MGKGLVQFRPQSFGPTEICCGQEGSSIKQFQMKNERAVWELGFVARQAAFTAYRSSFMVTAMDEGRRDNTSRVGGLPTLPGLNLSTFQPSVHLCEGLASLSPNFTTF